MILNVFDCGTDRCPDESVGPTSGSVQHRTGRRSHRYQDLRRRHELPGERLRSLPKGPILNSFKLIQL